MPFTPLHMGPALVIKAAGGRHFSVLVFGIAQVAMDIEPLLCIINVWSVLHGWTHTWIGATLIGCAVLLLAPPLCAKDTAALEPRTGASPPALAALAGADHAHRSGDRRLHRHLEPCTVRQRDACRHAAVAAMVGGTTRCSACCRSIRCIWFASSPGLPVYCFGLGCAA